MMKLATKLSHLRKRSQTLITDPFKIKNEREKRARFEADLARMVAEREGVLRDLTQTRSEGEQLRAERDGLLRDLTQTRSEGEQLRAERDGLLRDLTQARAEGEQLRAERDGLLPELTQFQADRDRLSVEVRELTTDRNCTRNSLAVFAEAVAQRLDNVAAHQLALSARQEQFLYTLRHDDGRHHGDSDAHELYLNLLEAALTGVLYEDDSIAPWAFGKYDPEVRAIGRDWPRKAKTMIGTARMRNLRNLTLRALRENVPGDMIETGVWRGGACIYMKGILAAIGDRQRRVFVADSFAGLPEPNEELYPADKGDTHSTVKELAISREEVTANFRQYGLLDERVVFLEGWFKDTLPTAPIDKLAILRLDGDMYESTMDALNALYHKVAPGGFVIVDDYILKPCAKAINEFRASHDIHAELNHVDGAAVWWEVPKS